MIRMLLIACVCMLTGVRTPAAESPEAPSSTLQVIAEAFRNDRGTARFALFDRANGFPDDPETALRTVSTPIRDGRCAVVFENVRDGRYALSVLHDENANGRMDTTFFGAPREGYAVSGHPTKRLARPDFEDAVFDFNASNTVFTLTVLY